MASKPNKSVLTSRERIEQVSRDSHIITLDVPPAGRWVLLTSDEHIDNVACQRALLKKHHEQALERNAVILKFGDVFCAMQGKWDQRADQDELIPELQGQNYLDRLVDFATDFYQPYASNILLIGTGNHEQKIRQKHQTDLIDRLTANLRKTSSYTCRGGYTGWVTFQFLKQKDPKVKGSKTLLYHHGWGGGGAVTKGLPDFHRLNAQYNADIYALGHIHQKMVTRSRKQYVTNRSGRIANRDVYEIRCGSYMDPYDPKLDSGIGWNKETQKGPRPLGGWWIHFTLNGQTGQPLISIQEAS